MEHSSIFSSTLGLVAPWEITRVDLSEAHTRLDIYIRCNNAARICCPLCGHDADQCGGEEQSWLHYDFFHKPAYLHVTVPVLKCLAQCGTQRPPGPWSRPGSRFIPVGKSDCCDQREEG